MKGTKLVLQMEAGGEMEMAQQQRGVTIPNMPTCLFLTSYRDCGGGRGREGKEKTRI